MSSIGRRLRGVGALFALLLLSQPALAQQAGYVFDIAGRWTLGDDAGRSLSRGDRLPAGGVIRAQSPAADDFIVIVDNDGEIIARRRCARPEECRQPVTLPAARRPRPSAVHVLVESVMTLLWGEPDTYVPLRSRGIGVDLLQEGVALLKGGVVDLRMIFSKLPEGVYHFRMREVAGRGKAAPGEWAGPFELKWGPGAPAAHTAPGLRPGLFEVELLSGTEGMYLPTGTSAWVLVGEQAAFDRAAAAHREAAELAGRWGDDVSSEMRRGFLRAHLAHLARGGAE